MSSNSSFSSSLDSLRVQCEDLETLMSERYRQERLVKGGGMKGKEKVKKKTALERVFGEKGFGKNHYFSCGTQITDANQRNLLSEPSPFIYPRENEELSFKVLNSEWKEKLRRKELKLRYNLRNNYRSRQQLDVLNRLYVNEPQQQSMRTILDIDPDFFTIVSGRPVKTKKFDIKTYVKQLRETLKTKIVCGFRDDEIMLLDEKFLQEQKIIDDIKVRLQRYIDTFEEFIFNDHTTAMDLLDKAEKETNLAFAKYDTFREISLDYGALKSQVYNLEEKWRNMKMYQKFLYLISPLSWREENDYYHFTPEGTSRKCNDDTNVLFGRYKLLDENVSLEDLITMFKDDVQMQEPPKLYFTEPHQLLIVFRFIELQNLNSLLHTEELAIPIENIKNGMQSAKIKFDAEINKLNDIINSLEGDIIWEEKRAASLQNLALDLINGVFQELISAENVLNLYVFVEDVYENRLAPNDANLGIMDMMKGIEMLLRNYLLELDSLPEAKVHKAEMDCYFEEARIMKIAQEAAKKVIQIERQAKRLNRVLEPPFQRTHKAMVWRSPPIDRTLRTRVEVRPLTNEEIEYLDLFTDYCKYTDNPIEYVKRYKSEDGQK